MGVYFQARRYRRIAMTKTLLLLTLAVSVMGAQTYDLLLKGGRVVDAKNRINALMDVAIAGGKSPASRPTFRLPHRGKPLASPGCW